jgi:hypothetical protein
MSRILLVAHGSTTRCTDLTRVFLSFINKYITGFIGVPVSNGRPFDNFRIIILFRTVPS